MNKNTTNLIIYKDISIFKNILTVSRNIILEKSNFDFSTFYIKYKNHLPYNILPSSNFLSWFIGFTEGDGSFIIEEI